jgi:hypothetical protein
MLNNLFFFLGYTAGVFGGISMFINFILAPLTLRWKFDKQFDVANVTCVTPWNGPMLRSMLYMNAIVMFDTKKRRPMPYFCWSFSEECKQFDFRALASKYDLILSFTYLISAGITFFCAFAWTFVRAIMYFSS